MRPPTKADLGPLTATEVLYIRSMGKALRIVAMFTSDDAANDYMARHDTAAVVAVLRNGCILLADKYDTGTPIPKET